MRTKAVLFDLFETLMTEWGHKKYTKSEMSSDLGVDQALFNQCWDENEQKRYLGEIDFTDSIRYACERCGKAIDSATLDAVMEKRVLTKSACFHYVHQEVYQLLEKLKGMGLKTAMVSNCSAEEVEGISESKLYPFFDQTILSYQVGLQKPDSRIYHRAADLLEVAPEECVFVGDGGSNELEGARNAGMRAVQAKWYTNQLPYRRESIPGFSVAEEPLVVLDFIV